MQKTRAIFFDRDGVINELVERPNGTLTSPWKIEEFKFLPYVKEAVKTVKDLGFTLVYDFIQKGWTYWTSMDNNVEGYFKCLFYARYNNMDLMQHETNGKIYQFDPNTYEDDGNPIAVLARTPLVDFGNNERISIFISYSILH